MTHANIGNLVIHPGNSMCQSMTPPGRAWWDTPHCATCTCTRNVQQPEHGHWVTCGMCGQTGIVPDPGFEQELLSRWVPWLKVRGGPDPE